MVNPTIQINRTSRLFGVLTIQIIQKDLYEYTKNSSIYE